MTGIVFSLIFLHTFPSQSFLNFENLVLFQMLAWWVIASFLIIIFIYDAKYYLILDKVSIPAIFLALIFNLVLGANILNLLFAGLIAGGFFLLQYSLTLLLVLLVFLCLNYV